MEKKGGNVFPPPGLHWGKFSKIGENFPDNRGNKKHWMWRSRYCRAWSAIFLRGGHLTLHQAGRPPVPTHPAPSTNGRRTHTILCTMFSLWIRWHVPSIRLSICITKW